MKKTVVIEVIIFVVCSGLLLAAAQFSDSLVPSNFERELFKQSVIEPRDNVFGVCQIDDTFIWMAGNNGKLIRSKDQGKTWQDLNSGTIQHLQDIGAWDRDRIVAVGNDGVIIISGNGGDTWTAVEAPRSGIENKLFRVKIHPEGRAWICGAMGTVLLTDDYGQTWIRSIPEEDISFNDIAFATDEIGVVVGEYGFIKRTDDGGGSWREIESPVEISLMAVAFDGNGIGIAVGLEGTILRSKDFGETWENQMEAGTGEHIYNIMHDGNQWFGVGDRGIIVSAPDSGDQWEASQLSATDLLWHVGIAPMKNRLIIVGGTQGIYEDGQWSYIF